MKLLTDCLLVEERVTGVIVNSPADHISFSLIIRNCLNVKLLRSDFFQNVVAEDAHSGHASVSKSWTRDVDITSDTIIGTSILNRWP